MVRWDAPNWSLKIQLTFLCCRSPVFHPCWERLHVSYCCCFQGNCDQNSVTERDLWKKGTFLAYSWKGRDHSGRRWVWKKAAGAEDWEMASAKARHEVENEVELGQSSKHSMHLLSHSPVITSSSKVLEPPQIVPPTGIKFSNTWAMGIISYSNDHKLYVSFKLASP